ncbi:hypothetical protein ACTXGK_10830 [Psychrobacter sp. T6-5]|uniref:hypothetical protein n=1 Tax=Psychrobacter sp. T6-5 TaxID=3457451 RepID=UPI003FD4EF42
MVDLEHVKEQLLKAIHHEIPIEIILDYHDTLYAKLDAVSRYVLQELSHPNIKGPATGQNEHFAIQQATCDVFDNTTIKYNLVETEAKGAFFPLIELEGIALLPKRSVTRQEWRKAKYMRDLAKQNQNENLHFKQDDLFTPNTTMTTDNYSNYITSKILVIVDICFLDTLYIKFIVPSSDLKDIHLTVSLEDVISDIETVSDTKDTEPNPTSKLKKSLLELDKIVKNA